MKLTFQEIALIEFIRTQCFEDVLDATQGIIEQAEKAFNLSKIKALSGDRLNEKAFMERYNNLEKLAELLGDSNIDYRRHIDPDFEEPEVNKECNLLQ